MLFNSIDFLIFFPLVAAIFFVIPKKLRYIWLLIASYYFYMSWNPKYAILIALSTFITYISSIFIQKYNDQKRIVLKKVCLAGSIVSNLSILCLFKYANFIIINISKLLSILNIGIIERRLDLLLPVGISFYTFQALSYTIDVYRGEIKAETNIFKYALFVSFFPQLVAGPIERSKNLLCQINNIDHISVWNFEQVKRHCRQGCSTGKHGVSALSELWFFRNIHCSHIIRISNLLRFRRIYQYCKRLRLCYGFSSDEQFPAALSRTKHQRFLAKVAHIPYFLVYRLSLYPSWRKQKRAT